MVKVELVKVEYSTYGPIHLSFSTFEVHELIRVKVELVMVDHSTCGPFSFLSKENLVGKPKRCFLKFVDGIPSKPTGVESRLVQQTQGDPNRASVDMKLAKCPTTSVTTV
jgi:hypothetical protein